jgi:hypothetical protein
MEAPATASWDQIISDADFSKLKAGFEALDMEDRWEIKADDPDKNGIISIHISRSWAEIDHYILAVKPIDGGGGKITSITWDQNKGEIHVGEEQGKKEAVIVCRMIVKCEFETLPLYDRSILWAG